MDRGAFVPGRSRSNSIRIAALSLTLAAGFALTACGGGPSAAPTRGAGVASLPATTPATTGGAEPGGSKATAPSRKADDGRPLLRVDTSDAERERLFEVYATCLRNHGMKPDPKKQAAVYGITGNATDSPEAFQACQSKEPLEPAALDPARNPRYADNKRDWINCINKNSPVIKVVANKGGWTYASSNSGSEADHDTFDKIERTCMLKAFGRG